MRGRALLALLLLPLAGACRTGVPDRAVATTKEGIVTPEDVDDYLIALPAAKRRATGRDAEGYERVVKEIVVERALRAEASSRGLADAPEVVEAAIEVEREALAELCLEKISPGPLPAVPEDEVRAYYDEHRERYRRPARRLVSHIFVEPREGEAREATRARAESLRQRILAGAAFQDVAREQSDSETRGQGGMLGWIDEDKAPPGLAKVVFALPTGVPSEVVGTKDGYHLFLVESAQEGREFTFEEMRRTLLQQLLGQRQEDSVALLTRDSPLPESAYVPSEEELRGIVGSGDPDAVVLRVDDYELRLRRLLALAGEAGKGTQAPGWLPWQVVRGIVRRERLCHHCTRIGAIQPDELESRIARKRDEILVRFARTARLHRWLSEHPEAVEAFFARHERRFMTPLRFHLRSGKLDGAGRAGRMAELARGVEAVNAGTQTFDALAAQAGATVEDLGITTFDALKRGDARLAAQLSRLSSGQVIGPVNRDGSFELLELHERMEPRLRKLAEVRDEVEVAYLEAHQQEVYRAVQEEMLQGVGFQPHPERLQELVRRRPEAAPPSGG